MPLPQRNRLRALCAPPAPARAHPFGDAEIDAHLPGGGLPLGALHEVHATGIEQQTGALAAGFAALMAARLPGALLWAAQVCDLYAPGLQSYGLDPARLIQVHTRNDAETLGVMEIALREGGVGAVLGEVSALARLPARRLHLACLRHGVTAFAIRRQPYGPGRPTRDSTAAATRWRLSPAPSAADQREPGIPRWMLELLYARGGREGAWTVELTDTHTIRTVTPTGEFRDLPGRLKRA